MATRRRRGPVKGRVLVAWGLLLFLVVATVVVWRRSIGVVTQQEIRALEREKAMLLSTRTILQKEVQEASSRVKVIAAAERRLGLHVATGFQTRNIADSIAPADSLR
ncbi:MAG TPA: hypothetical protein VE869_04790 [Gemmatimonas sp.]|nr:hypothetical protein [Gemmatimonas sp.]